MSENEDKNLLNYFLYNVLPGLLIILVIMLLVSQCEVQGVTVEQDTPLEPTSIEISSDGDTTYVYEIRLDDEDESSKKTLNIKFGGE